ncbi:hypothetical protein [Spirosoma gilvum]
MNLAQLTHFLQTHFHPTAHSLQPIGAGMFSQAYRFEADKEAFVLRIGVTREAFEKISLPLSTSVRPYQFRMYWPLGRTTHRISIAFRTGIPDRF